MCGRYKVGDGVKSAFKEWGIDFPTGLEEKQIAAPGMSLPVITGNGSFKAELMKWGLVPFWSRESKVKFATFNARAETLSIAPAYRESFVKKRCLVPADAYFEWRKLEGKTKIPYMFRAKDRKYFMFAGIWDEWRKKESFRSFSIVTCLPNDTVSPFHNRMPVILPREKEKFWIDESVSSAQLMKMLLPFEGKMDSVRLANVF